MNKSEYQGFFAEFYDILHSELMDVEVYINFSKKYGLTILELGSGTGRITIPLAKKGFKVTGLELNDDMINICKDKLQAEDEEIRDNVRLIKGDMTEFNLGEKFDLIIAPCNVINHLISLDSLERTLNCVKDHLDENGTFIIDNSLPDIEFMVSSNNVEEVYEFIHPKTRTKIVDRFTAKYDFINQIEKDHIILEEYRGDKLIRHAESTETLTYFLPRELRIILKHMGFKIIEERGSLINGGPIGERSREMVYICKLE
jgi:SAM-dependent methyltransferase